MEPRGSLTSWLEVNKVKKILAYSQERWSVTSSPVMGKSSPSLPDSASTTESFSIVLRRSSKYSFLCLATSCCIQCKQETVSSSWVTWQFPRIASRLKVFLHGFTKIFPHASFWLLPELHWLVSTCQLPPESQRLIMLSRTSSSAWRLSLHLQCPTSGSGITS